MNKIKTAIFIAGVFTMVPGTVLAQVGSSGIAETVEMETNALEMGDGTIVCSGEKGAILCNQPYAVNMMGVYVLNPAVELENTTMVNGRAVLSSGMANVRVNSGNGSIKKGDFITSSSISGVGQLADKSGNVLGVALEAYINDDKSVVGQILVSIDIRAAVVSTSARGNLLETMKQGLLAPT